MTFLLVFIACLVFAAPAAAMSDEEMLAYAKPIAEAAWERPQCPQVAVELHADAKLNAIGEFENKLLGGYSFPVNWTHPEAMPYRDTPKCTILVRSTRLESGNTATLTFDQFTFCEMLVHEYGHLAGHAHDAEDPIMNGSGFWVYEPCVTGVPASAPRAAKLRLGEPVAAQPEAPVRPLAQWEKIRNEIAKRKRQRADCRPLRSGAPGRLVVVCRSGGRRYVGRADGSWWREELRSRRR